MDVRNPTSGTHKDKRVEPEEHMAQLAGAGKLEELLHYLQQRPGLVSTSTASHFVSQAVDVLSRSAPEDFADVSFRQILSFSLYALARVQTVTFAHLDDPALRPERFIEDFGALRFPLLQALQMHVADMQQAWATTRRMWKLAGKGRKRRSSSLPLNGALPRTRRALNPGDYHGIN